MNTLDPIERQVLTTAQTWVASAAQAHPQQASADQPSAAATSSTPTSATPAGSAPRPDTWTDAPLPASPEDMADLIRQAAAIPPDVIRTALLLEEIGRLAAAELTWVATAPDALRPQAITLIVEHLSARTPHPREHLHLIVNALTGEAGTLRQIISAENRA